jgi:cytochrome P450
VANAVEESLRFDAPLRGLFRTSTRPARIDDVDMAAGAKVLPSLAAANRDPALWDDADTFDITRALPALRRHYAFGHGAHYCLGAPLARLEATAALSAILDHLPGLRPDGVPQRISADILSGFDRLPVAWVIAGTV